MQRTVKFNASDTENKVAVIKLVRAASMLSLRDAKHLVEETTDSPQSSSEMSGTWKNEDDFQDWLRQMVQNGVVIVGHAVEPPLSSETTERLVGNAQQLIIDCIMERAWNMARDLIDVLERHDSRSGD